jgi:hypothetical protein
MLQSALWGGDPLNPLSASPHRLIGPYTAEPISLNHESHEWGGSADQASASPLRLKVLAKIVDQTAWNRFYSSQPARANNNNDNNNNVRFYLLKVPK